MLAIDFLQHGQILFRVGQIHQLGVQLRFVGAQQILFLFKLALKLPEQIVHRIVRLVHQTADSPDGIGGVEHGGRVNIRRVFVGLFNNVIAHFAQPALGILASLPCQLILLHHVVNASIETIQQIQKLFAIHNHFIRHPIVCGTIGKRYVDFF